MIKSGTDFRDLSSATLHLSSPSDDTRKRVVDRLSGKHHYITPSSPSSKAMEDLLKSLLSSVSSTLSKPVCWSLTPFDARSEIVRTQETGLGNWVADVLIHAYAESLLEKGPDATAERKGEKRDFTGVDAVIICGGTLRGDSQYGPGKITLGDILGECRCGRGLMAEILPFEDPVVCIEVVRTLDKANFRSMEKASGIPWRAHCPNGRLKKGEYSLEAVTDHRRFPIVSGLRVEWDHTLPPGKRVKSIRQVIHPSEDDDEVDNPEDMVDFVEQNDGTRVEVKQRKVDVGDEIENEKGGKIYRVVRFEHGIADSRSHGNTWQRVMTVSKRSRGENSSLTMKMGRSCPVSSDLSS